MGYKVLLNYWLWCLGLRDVLPSYYVKRVKVQENHDPLVSIIGQGDWIISPTLTHHENCVMRSEALLRLQLAETYLPKGVFLKIYEVYRPLEVQQASWQRRLVETRKEHPEANEEDIQRLTRMKVSEASSQKDQTGGHQTGGALDLSLCDADGNDLDMGSRVHQHGPLEITRNRLITEAQQANRFLLKRAMETAGFKNFPGEFWHYAYGDRLWAAYSGLKECMYGFVENLPA